MNDKKYKITSTIIYISLILCWICNIALVLIFGPNKIGQIIAYCFLIALLIIFIEIDKSHNKQHKVDREMINYLISTLDKVFHSQLKSVLEEDKDE